MYQSGSPIRKGDACVSEGDSGGQGRGERSEKGEGKSEIEENYTRELE